MKFKKRLSMCKLIGLSNHYILGFYFIPWTSGLFCCVCLLFDENVDFSLYSKEIDCQLTRTLLAITGLSQRSRTTSYWINYRLNFEMRNENLIRRMWSESVQWFTKWWFNDKMLGLFGPQLNLDLVDVLIAVLIIYAIKCLMHSPRVPSVWSPTFSRYRIRQKERCVSGMNHLFKWSRLLRWK